MRAADDRLREIDGRLHARILIMLDVLDKAVRPGDMNVLGFKFHALQGYKPRRYTAYVNKSLRVTFEFENENAYAVALEDYH